MITTQIFEKIDLMINDGVKVDDLEILSNETSNLILAQEMSSYSNESIITVKEFFGIPVKIYPLLDNGIYLINTAWKPFQLKLNIE